MITVTETLAAEESSKLIQLERGGSDLTARTCKGHGLGEPAQQGWHHSSHSDNKTSAGVRIE